MDIVALSFDNRERAILIWIGILFIWGISKPNIRRAFFAVLSTITKKVILITLILMIIYIGGMIFLFRHFNIWDLSLLGETIIWIFGVAFVLYGNITKIKNFDFFKKTVKEGIKITILLEFVVNLYVFNFWVELLIFIPAMALLGGVLGVMITDKKYKQAENFLLRLTSFLGIIILGYVLVNVIIDFKGFASVGNVKEFALPILFTTFFLPYIYCLALYLIYDQITIHIKRLISNKALARYTYLKTILRFNINLEKLHRWDKKLIIGKFESKEEINSAMKVV